MSKKTPADQLREFLKEHLKYEIDMLRFTYARMERLEYPSLEWNSNFESFGIHARNLYWFVRNEGSNTFRAIDYVTNRKVPDAIGRNSVLMLSESFFHLSKARLKRKFESSRADELYSWIALHWDAWLAELPREYSDLVRSLRLGVPMVRVSSEPVATNQISSASLDVRSGRNDDHQR